MAYFPIQPLFPLGDILCSPGVQDLGIDITHLIRRHQAGDWGDLCDDDRDANQQALKNHDAILSKYQLNNYAGVDETLCVMTVSNRSVTVVLLHRESLEEPGID